MAGCGYKVRCVKGMSNCRDKVRYCKTAGGGDKLRCVNGMATRIQGYLFVNDI